MFSIGKRARIGFRSWLYRGFGIVLCLIGFGAFSIWQLAVPAGRAGGALVPFTISRGQSVKQIAVELQGAGLLHSRWWFEGWVWVAGKEGSFVAGEYSLPPRVSALNLVTLLTGGTTPTCEQSLRFIEGWTTRQMQSYLEGVPYPGAAKLGTFVGSPKQYSASLSSASVELWQGKPATASLEGYLFPDTYRVYCDGDVGTLVSKMVANFDHHLLPTWRAQLAKRGYTLFQGLTLASIVEKEVPGDADRATVADIFWRRLKAGQALQADSTINYVTGKKSPGVSTQDLALDSPYNTYRYRGLPPGPISNPGESALRSVAFPTANSYWYFLTTPEGKVIYSKTFDEHLKAKAKYLH